MHSLFENLDHLQSPFEGFLFDSRKNGVSILPHWHYYAEAICFVKGQALVQAGGQSCLAREGELIFFPPSQVHSISSPYPAPLQYMVIKFDPVSVAASLRPEERRSLALGHLLSASPDAPLLHFRFAEKEEGVSSLMIQGIFETCIREFTSSEPGFLSFIQASLCQLLLLLLRCGPTGEASSRAFALSASQSAAKAGPITPEALGEYIDLHLEEPLPAEELAALCHMSYSHFARRFLLTYGCSCRKYILRQRLYRAERMLISTSYDLSRISQECGFSDCSHLIRTFRRRYGLTPGKYRCIHTKNPKPDVS